MKPGPQCTQDRRQYVPLSKTAQGSCGFNEVRLLELFFLWKKPGKSPRLPFSSYQAHLYKKTVRTDDLSSCVHLMKRDWNKNNLVTKCEYIKSIAT